MKQRLYCVYWIKHDDHTDFLRDGYIGITCNAKKRFQNHQSKSSFCKHLYAALNKHKSKVKVNILANNLDYEAAMLLEKMLRPEPSIGWNIKSGGQEPRYSVQTDPRSCNAGIYNPRYKGRVIATNIISGEKLYLIGEKEMKENGFHSGLISDCIKGKRNQHKGYTFIRESI